ncbi:hypothetical protein C8R44DRAFT_978355 [Mycena epipterygia]|nr:hypothetical protein C8R44DRAFT_978355 [Mycena epipterygia]
MPNVDLQPTPLPPNPFSVDSHASAYNVFRNDAPQTMFDMGPVLAGRVLGYALIYAPNSGGRDALARDINCCDNNDEFLAGLAFLYIMVLYAFSEIRKVRLQQFRRTLKVLGSLDAAGDQPRENYAPPGRIPHILKEQILFRDQFTCAFSHVIDRDSFEKGIATRHADTLGFGNVQVAHIISQPLTDGIGGMSEAAKEKHNWASCASAILDGFAGIEIRPLDLHNPMNVLLAGLEPHMNFGRQCMWLSAVKDETGNVVPETYNVCLRKELDRCIGMREQITFQARMYKGEMILPPSADLLQLHASCAHIAHLSGAAGVLDDPGQYFSELRVLERIRKIQLAKTPEKPTRNTDVNTTRILVPMPPPCVSSGQESGNSEYDQLDSDSDDENSTPRALLPPAPRSQTVVTAPDSEDTPPASSFSVDSQAVVDRLYVNGNLSRESALERICFDSRSERQLVRSPEAAHSPACDVTAGPAEPEDSERRCPGPSSFFDRPSYPFGIVKFVKTVPFNILPPPCSFVCFVFLV